MCGMTGWLAYSRDMKNHRDVLQRMTCTMAPRGPDAEGIWIDGPIGLGHRRLAVIDLQGGAQPMVSEVDGRQGAVVLVYTGEVYNFKELRSELAALGHQFETRSDTEVVLRACQQWGAECATKFNGMYAFAFWNQRSQELILVRDRMGVKPLYYYETEDGVIFGSEPKALLANPLVPRTLAADGLREILEMVKTPGHAVFAGMREVKPGEVVVVNRGGLTRRRYWWLEAHEHRDTLEQTIQHTRELLEDIVMRQVVADVPLCSLLSGGLDSSVITALASKKTAGCGQRKHPFLFGGLSLARG